MPRGPAAAADGDVEPADRLEAELVAQDEHVERHLDARLVVDLAGGRARDPTCSRSRSPRALSGSTSTRSIFPLTATPSPRSYELNETSSLRGTNRDGAARLVADELLEVATQAVQQLAALRRR